MAGYVISCPSISSCLCCVSLDISLDGDTLKDLGAPVDTPLRASLGGEGEANAAVCGTSGASFIAEYGTDGQAPLVGLYESINKILVRVDDSEALTE